MFDTSACVDLIFLFVTQVDLEGEGGRTTLYLLLLYLKVYPLSVSVSISLSVYLSVCLSVCLCLSLYLSLSVSLCLSLSTFFPSFLSSYLLICTRQSNIFLRCLSAISPENHFFLFFYSLVYCNFFVWNYCVPIYDCLLVVLFVRLPVFWLYYIGHGL